MNLFKTIREQMMLVILPIFWRSQKIMLFWKHPRNQKKYFLKLLTLCSKTWVNSKTGLFLSPATQKFHDKIEKATKLSEVVYNSQKLKEVRKNIIESINHILNHDLVCEIPAAANFVGMIESNMQEIKEKFNKVVLWIFGSNIGKDNEVCFPSYKNNKKKQVGKQYKGIAG